MSSVKENFTIEREYYNILGMFSRESKMMSTRNKLTSLYKVKYYGS